MLGRVCIVFIAVFVLATSVTAHTACNGLCQNTVQYNGLVGQADIPNGTIGIACLDHTLVGSAVGMKLIHVNPTLSYYGMTPGQMIYIIQTTQTGYPLGSGTVIPYNPVWYLPSWWHNLY